jgi:uncharacterized membrane protein YfcA
MTIKIIAVVIALAGLGMVFYLLYGKNQKKWDEMTIEEQKRKKTLITGGILVFLAGMLAAIFHREKDN